MNILLIGASSAIATAVARRYAAHQSGLFLIARDGSRLAPQKEDLKIRGAARVGAREVAHDLRHDLGGDGGLRGLRGRGRGARQRGQTRDADGDN